MTQATKCRAADDVLTAADGHPSLESARRELWQLPTTELLHLTVGTGPLPERAIALWYVLGTNPRTCQMRERRGEPQLAFEAMRLINAEFLSRSCTRISQMMKRHDEELRKNAESIEASVRTLNRMRARPIAVAAPSIVAELPSGRMPAPMGI